MEALSQDYKRTEHRDKRAGTLESLVHESYHGKGLLPAAWSPAQMQFLLPVALSPLQADPMFDSSEPSGPPQTFSACLWLCFQPQHGLFDLCCFFNPFLDIPNILEYVALKTVIRQPAISSQLPSETGIIITN